MNIVFLDKQTLGDDVNYTQLESIKDAKITYHQTTSKKQTLQRIQNQDIVVTNKVIIDKNLMDNSNIKLICVAATGMNNIDLEYAKLKNIEVKNVVGYSTSSVVQTTFMLGLNLIMSSNYYDNFVKSKEYEKSPIFTNISKPFFELNGKRWGIIGLGNIGKEVAKIASSFGCDVCYYSTSGANDNKSYQKVELEELLCTCDIVSIHSPLNPQTLNLITQKELKLLKDGAVLLNLGRGGIINESDLADIIDSDKDILVGLDVLSAEPIKADNPLNNIKNHHKIQFTPHIAWASKEARDRLLDGIYQNILDFVQK
jgi:glycerate dehydrogenase